MTLYLFSHYSHAAFYHFQHNEDVVIGHDPLFLLLLKVNVPESAEDVQN